MKNLLAFLFLSLLVVSCQTKTNTENTSSTLKTPEKKRTMSVYAQKLVGTWTITQLNSQKIASNKAILKFRENGKFNSHVCNSLMTSYKVPSDSEIQINMIGAASTMMACLDKDGKMDPLENNVNSSLRKVKNYTLTENTLVLLDENKNELIVLKKK